MAKQTINLGTTPNRGDGDPLRTAFRKINENFDELYSGAASELGAFEFGGSTITTTDSSDITIAQNVTITSDLTMSGDIVPAADNAYDLGSPTQQWRSLYLTGNTVYFNGVPLSVTDDGTLIIDGQVAATPGGATTWDSVTNKPAFANVAISGSYNDLTDIPTIPDVSNFITAADIPRDYQGSVFADDSTLLVDGVNASIPYSVLSGAPAIPVDVSDLTDTGNLLGIGSADSLTSNNDINITINNDDSSSYIWNYGNTGTLTLPNSQQVDASDANLLQIGTANAGVRLNSLDKSVLLIAKKSFNRGFSNGDGDYTITATAGSEGIPHIVTVTFSPNAGLYFRQLLVRLEEKLLFGNNDFIWDYSNVRINLNPDDQALVANITTLTQTNSAPWTYEITIDQDPTAVVGILTDIIISYDYNNTIGLDVEADRFGMATDNDDIDIRSGRDINLIAADDILLTAGSTLEITLNQNDAQADSNGIQLRTSNNIGNNNWTFRFDGKLELPSGGVISETVITSNPTIVIEPALADSPNQGLYIKGGIAPGDFHLHLTTGDLSDTSIILGTDDHNVRTTVDGGVEINTFLYPSGGGSGRWIFDNNGILTFPGSSTATIGEDEPGLAIRSEAGFAVLTNVTSNTYEVEFIGYVSDGFGDASGATLTVTEIIAGTITDGMTIYGAGLPPEGWVVTFDGGLLPPVGSGGTGNYLLSGANILTSSQSFNNDVLAAGSNAWIFGADGKLTLPGNIATLEIDEANPDGGLVVSVDAGIPGSEYKSLYKFGRGGQFTSRAISVTNANGDRVGGLTGDGFGPILNAPADKEVWISTDGQHLWRFTADRDFVLPYGGGNIRSEGNINIDINLSDSTMRRWQFGEDGDLTVPGKISGGDSSGNLDITASNYVTIESTDGGQIMLGANQLVGGNNGTVVIGHAGNITDLNSGKLRILNATVPTTSVGAVGDVAGFVAFDASYIYYCTGAYDSVTNIWKRVAWSGDTW